MDRSRSYTHSQGVKGKISQAKPGKKSWPPIKFQIAGSGGFTDSASATYSPIGGNKIIQQGAKWVSKLSDISELAWSFQGSEPKTLNIPIYWTLHEYKKETIVNNIATLQSLCHTRGFEGAFRNPEKVRLTIHKLYDLVVWVTNVNVTWMDTWRKKIEGMPIGATVELGVMIAQVYTASEIRAGKGFKNAPSGWARDKDIKLPSINIF